MRGKPTPSRPLFTLILAVAALAAIYEWLVFATTFVRPGLIGINYNAVGSDWIVFHGAARAWLEGRLPMIWDGDRFTAYLNHSYGWWLTSRLSFRPWVYPPSYLLLLVPFGRLGLLTSYALFQGLTAAALVSSVVVGARGDRRMAWSIALCAVLSPAAAVNAVCGQNALLVAALLVAGVRLAPRRPLLAGVVLGILTIKPQFALMAPIALVAGRHWRALGAAAGASLLLALVSGAVFGSDAWIAWIHEAVAGGAAPSAKWVEYGRMWGHSVWTCAVLLGAPSPVASALQLLAALLAAAAVAVAFGARFSEPSRIAVLLVASCLAAPHWSPYDAVLLALAGLYWLTHLEDTGAAAWPWILGLLLWMVPLFSPPVLVPVARLTPLLLVAFLVVLIRGRGETDPAQAPGRLVAQ